MNFVSTNLRSLRADKGETQQQTADAVKLKKTTYANYETGHSTPGLDELVVLSKHFGVTIDALLKDELQFSKHLTAAAETLNARKTGKKKKESQASTVSEPSAEYNTDITVGDLFRALAAKMDQMEKKVSQLEQDRKN